MNAALGLKESSRVRILALLDAVLADEYSSTRRPATSTGTSSGRSFNDLHKFFEAQYEQLDGFVDAVAERSRALGGRALGALKEFLARTRLKESLGRTSTAAACSPSSCATMRR